MFNLETLLANQPAYRIKQVISNFFNPNIQSFQDMTNLPLPVRETLTANHPFLTVTEHLVQTNRTKDTHKAVLKLQSQEVIETVLMKNAKNQWTICVSSQVGCAMNCSFCATGKMGLIRSLSAEEIIDQYRFWLYYIHKNFNHHSNPDDNAAGNGFSGNQQLSESSQKALDTRQNQNLTRSLLNVNEDLNPDDNAVGNGFSGNQQLSESSQKALDTRQNQNLTRSLLNVNEDLNFDDNAVDNGFSELSLNRISNIVYMGMGEPLANYIQVKKSLNTILEHTDIGPTKITVSTVGIIPSLKKMLTDPEWPKVRIALSIHSAKLSTRKAIVPTTFQQFLSEIQSWSQQYLTQLGNNTHHLTFEYVMLRNINDTEEHAQILANYVHKCGNIKVNLIPYNFIGALYETSTAEQIKKFSKILKQKGVQVTVRKNMGTDIEAACGQLAGK